MIDTKVLEKIAQLDDAKDFLGISNQVVSKKVIDI